MRAITCGEFLSMYISIWVLLVLKDLMFLYIISISSRLFDWGNSFGCIVLDGLSFARKVFFLRFLDVFLLVRSYWTSLSLLYFVGGLDPWNYHLLSFCREVHRLQQK